MDEEADEVSEEEEELYEPEWRKPCPMSVVLFATDGRGNAIPISHQGPEAAWFMSECLDEFIEEELAPHRFPGLWVWEGTVETWANHLGEYDSAYRGKVRPLTEDEARAIREGDHVWDPGLWIEDYAERHHAKFVPLLPFR